MKLREINKKEFYEFCTEHPSNNFFQSRQWAEFKRLEGWHTYFVGLDHNGKIKAASMILSREIPIIKKRIFYAPRGFIINYKDLELVRSFTKHLKEYIETKNACFVRIDPYYELKDLDNEGKYIQGGNNNEKSIDVLRSLGYIQIDEHLTKPNTLYVVELKGKNNQEILDHMNIEVKNTIITNEKKGISTRDISKSEYPKLMELIKNNKPVVNFIDDHLEQFLHLFDEDKLLNVKFLEINIDQYLENASTDQELKQAKNLQYKYGHKVILGAAITVMFGSEATTLLTIIIDQFKDLLPQYTLHYDIMKTAKKLSMERYNLYGISDHLDDNLYQYYKGFNGHVVKLLGEFDLVINSFIYKRYYKYSKKNNLKITQFKKEN